MSDPPSTEQGGEAKLPGLIYTFYSYKGGVGRSMALANVAVCMALAGKKLLVIDWDLEAPGLEVFFSSARGCTLEGDPAQTPGVVDLLEPKEKDRTLDWRHCLLKAKFLGRSIDILSAGRRSDDYRQRVQQLDWATLYGEEHRVGNYIDGLRNEWRKKYDFVLVDSRTGITDIGDICTVLLPDVLVFLFVSNWQNINGIKTVMARAAKARGRLPVNRNQLLAVPLPSRDEIYSEHDKAMEWRQNYVEHLGYLYKDWLPKEITAADAMNKLFIPYVTIWSFGERIPILENSRETQDPTTIGAAYQRIATLLTNKLSWYSLEERASASEIQGTRVELQKAREDARVKQEEIERLAARRKSATKWTAGIAVSLVGVLAAIAIPGYQDYTIRAQVTEGFTLAAAAKASVAEAYAQNGVLPASNKEATLPEASSINGKYTDSVSVGPKGVISIRYGRAANLSIANKAALWTPTITIPGDVVWNCSSTEIAQKNLPAACRDENRVMEATPAETVVEPTRAQVATASAPASAPVLDEACLARALKTLQAEKPFRIDGNISCPARPGEPASTRVIYQAPANYIVLEGVKVSWLSGIGASGPPQYAPSPERATSVSTRLSCGSADKYDGPSEPLRMRLTGKIAREFSSGDREEATAACTVANPVQQQSTK